MVNRRQLFSLATLSGLGLYAAPGSAIEVRTGSDFVARFSATLMRILDGSVDAARQQAEIRELLDGTVDIDGIARFCLGRYASDFTPEQMQQFSGLFHQMLLRSIASRITAYNGAKLSVGRASAAGSAVSVQSVVQRADNAPTTVQWLVDGSAAAPKIIDLIVEGTSLRLTQRAEFEGFLLHHNGDAAALLTALRAKLQAAG